MPSPPHTTAKLKTDSVLFFYKKLMNEINLFQEVAFLCSLGVLTEYLKECPWAANFLTNSNFCPGIYAEISCNGEEGNKEDWKRGRKQPTNMNVSDKIKNRKKTQISHYVHRA